MVKARKTCSVSIWFLMPQIAVCKGFIWLLKSSDLRSPWCTDFFFPLRKVAVVWDDTGTLLCFFFPPHISGRYRWCLKEYFVMEREVKDPEGSSLISSVTIHIFLFFTLLGEGDTKHRSTKIKPQGPRELGFKQLRDVKLPAPANTPGCCSH